MGIKVKSGSDAATKFADRGGSAGPDYAAGVKGAGPDWEANTAAAADSFAAGVQDAISRNAFQKGVQRVGGAKYEKKATEVGSRRFPEGIRAAKGDYQNGVQPYLDTIAGLTLTPRRPKGDPSNFRRVEEIGMALRKKKLAS